MDTDPNDPFAETESDQQRIEDYLESNHLDETCFEKWRILGCGFEQMDWVAVQLDKLIREGKISKNHIFYKYVSDIVKMFIDPKHSFDDDVVEFFSTIMYLGGKKTFNFVRGPMFYGQGRMPNASRDFNTLRMNLGGPSESLCLKENAAFTTKSGVIKSLNQIHLVTLCEESTEKPEPLVSNDKLLVFPCTYSNDGTALKPAVEFDPVSKTNVGLTVSVDLDFIKENDPPDPKMLNELIVTEAVVGSVTSIDNKLSLPISVEYTPKSGKTGEKLKEMFEKHIKAIQLCKACVEYSKATDQIIDPNSICDSYCDDCYKNRELCPSCIDNGQVSIYPAVRICKACISENRQCVKRAVFVLTTDCEEGNKQMFLLIKNALEKMTIDPDLALMVPLPDTPHLGKSFKASFSNWILKLFNERTCLGFLHTLRNKSSKEEMEIMRKLLPKNDYVRNKDRQDPIAVLKLSEPKLVDHLSNIGYVAHTIIPETTKFTQKNKVGMYPSPLDVCLGPYGFLYILSHDQLKQSVNIYKVQLHNPVEKIELIKSVNAENIFFKDNRLYYFKPRGKICFIPTKTKDHTKLRSKKEILNYAATFGLKLTNEKTLSQLKSEVTQYVNLKKIEYQSNGFSELVVNVSGEPSFDALYFTDDDSLTIYACSDTEKTIFKLDGRFDGYVKSFFPFV